MKIKICKVCRKKGDMYFNYCCATSTVEVEDYKSDDSYIEGCY